MLLEQAAARVLVDGVGVVQVQRPVALLDVQRALRLARLVDRHAEHVKVGVQRELVHGVDAGQVVQDEEEQGGAHGRRPVRVARRVDLLLRLLRHAQVLRHLLRRLLRRLQRVDQALVVQQRPGRRLQQRQDQVLQVDQFAFVGGDGDDERALVLLELGLLEADQEPEQLILEALLLDGEVHDGALGAHLGRVVRVRQPRRHPEQEPVVVVQLLVAQLQVLAAVLRDDRLQQDRVQARVDLGAHILQRHSGQGVSQRSRTSATAPLPVAGRACRTGRRSRGRGPCPAPSCR